MDLKSGYPFWAIKNGLMRAFPQLATEVRCDVAIVGGGITGALVADELSRHGHEVVVVEQRDIGWGSTAASTALLRYEIDTHLIDLAGRYGVDDAVLAYRACVDAIHRLRELADEVDDVDFESMDSLYYASKRRHVDALRDEHALRRAHGLPALWLGPEAVQERFGIAAPGAILSTVAARVDPYRFTHRLFARLVQRGGHVFDRTAVDRLETTSRGVTLHTTSGARVRARHVVLAAGYAGQRFSKRSVARNRSSYAFVTDPQRADTRRCCKGSSSRSRRRSRWRAPSPRRPTACRSSGRSASTGRACCSRRPTAATASRTSTIGAALLRATIERREHPLAALFGFGRIA
jgi:glycine/D-amino acid oxidase-like deaminating enzyme